MSGLVAGVDVGGTKTRVILDSVDGARVGDVTVATSGWRGSTLAVKARLLADHVTDLARPHPAQPLAALAVGAHGCDLQEECEELREHLERLLPGVRCLVVNDAELVAPAAGSPGAIGLIAGTGSVAVGRAPDGRRIHAGGWGWVVGDEGGAAGIVREAVRASLRAVEDQSDDPLPVTLCRAMGVAHALDLPNHLLTNDPASWSLHAELIFDAATAGSLVARQIVDEAGESLADLVQRVVDGGARPPRIVAAGGVIVSQPALREALVRGLLRRSLDVDVELLAAPPAAGAIALAHDLLTP